MLIRRGDSRIAHGRIVMRPYIKREPSHTGWLSYLVAQLVREVVGEETAAIGVQVAHDYIDIGDVILFHHFLDGIAHGALFIVPGVSKEILHNIYWNNALGVMERCCM